MDDQRGELKGNLELPDFLKIPVSGKPTQGNDDFKVPYAPPPQGFRTVDRNVTRPALKKTFSTPISQATEKMDLMQELASKLSKRTEPTKNSSSPKEKVEIRNEQDEKLLDYNFNSRPQPAQQEQASHAVVNAHERQKRTQRPRSCTDATVYTVDMAHGMRVETGNRPRPVADAEPRENVHPSVRPQASQPVTVNSLRGMHYATNPRRNTTDPHDMYHRPNNALSAKPQTAARISSKSSQNLRDITPAIYDVKPGSHQGMRIKEHGDHSVKHSSSPVDIPSRRLVSAYSLPEVNTQRAEVHIPFAGGPPPVPQRTVSYMERRPRPKPITNPEELLAGLETTPVARSNASSSDRVESPPHQDMMKRVGSPLPPPPTPPSGSMYDLQIADFSPPPSICESPEKTSHPPEYRDSSNFAQSSASPTGSSFPNSTASQARTNSGSSPNYSGPVAYGNMSGKDVQRQRTSDNRTLNYSKMPITPHARISDVNGPTSAKSTQRVRSEDRVDTSQGHTQGSVTPTVTNLNKTVTPPSTNERTLVEESPSEHATPSTGHKPSMDNTAKRLIHNTGSVPRTRNADAEKRRSRQDGEMPKLDPYVTYEKEDLRITFV